MGTGMTDSKYSDIIRKEYLFEALEVDINMTIFAFCLLLLIMPKMELCS
jgi:hypothetical protein